MKTAILAALVGATAILSTPAMAQFQKPEDAIKYRKNALFVMSQHFGRIGAMVNNRAPFDAKVAADNAAIVLTVARLPFGAFGEGTDKGMPHRAKAEIWKDNAKFKAGNLDGMRSAFGAVGASCKACHDDFRADRYSAN